MTTAESTESVPEKVKVTKHRCTNGCGKNKPVSEFRLARNGQPINTCKDCLSDRMKLGQQRRRAAAKAMKASPGAKVKMPVASAKAAKGHNGFGSQGASVDTVIVTNLDIIIGFSRDNKVLPGKIVDLIKSLE